MDVHDIYHDFNVCASVFSSGPTESFGVLDEASLVFTGRSKGTEGTKFLLDIVHNRLTGFVLFLRGYVSLKIKSLCPKLSLTELSLLQGFEVLVHAQSCSNGVLLHTLKFLLLGRDLVLTDLVVHGRRRHVHRRKKTFHNRRNKNVCSRCALNSPRSRCHMFGHMVLVLQRCQQVQVPRTRLLKKALHRKRKGRR